MRLAELAGKEVVNMQNGARLGVIGDSDLVVNSHSGEIMSIIIPRKSNIFNIWLDKLHMVIPWEAVKKIGSEVMIVDLDESSPCYSSFI